VSGWSAKLVTNVYMLDSLRVVFSFYGAASYASAAGGQPVRVLPFSQICFTTGQPPALASLQSLPPRTLLHKPAPEGPQRAQHRDPLVGGAKRPPPYAFPRTH